MKIINWKIDNNNIETIITLKIKIFIKLTHLPNSYAETSELMENKCESDKRM